MATSKEPLRTITFRTVERWPTGHYNPHHNIVVTYRRKRFELEHRGGSSDQVYVCREGARVYVLNVNRGLQYAGLAEYDLAATDPTLTEYGSREPTAETFMDRDYDIAETFGKQGLDLSESTIVRRLSEHLPY